MIFRVAAGEGDAVPAAAHGRVRCARPAGGTSIASTGTNVPTRRRSSAGHHIFSDVPRRRQPDADHCTCWFTVPARRFHSGHLRAVQVHVGQAWLPTSTLSSGWPSRRTARSGCRRWCSRTTRSGGTAARVAGLGTTCDHARRTESPHRHRRRCTSNVRRDRARCASDRWTGRRVGMSQHLKLVFVSGSRAPCRRWPRRGARRPARRSWPAAPRSG